MHHHFCKTNPVQWTITKCMYVPQTLHTPLSEPAWHTIGDQVEAKLKHVDAESVEELVFPTFSLYFVNKQVPSGINNSK